MQSSLSHRLLDPSDIRLIDPTHSLKLPVRRKITTEAAALFEVGVVGVGAEQNASSIGGGAGGAGGGSHDASSASSKMIALAVELPLTLIRKVVSAVYELVSYVQFVFRTFLSSSSSFHLCVTLLL